MAIKRLSDNTKVALTILISFIIALSVLIGLEYYQYNNELRNNSSEKINNIKDSYSRLIDREVNKLFSTAWTITNNYEIKECFTKRNPDSLFNICLPIYEELKDTYNNPYWHFIEPDGSRFLSVSDMNYSEDKIKSSVIDNITQNNPFASGIELIEGKLIIYTLFPVYDIEKIIGYIEIGEETDHLLREIKSISGDELSLFIKKEYVTREQFDRNRLGKNVNIDWDDMENYVIIEHTKKIIYKEPLEINTMRDEGTFLEITELGNSYNSTSVFPIYDSLHTKIGGMLILSKSDQTYNNFIRRITTTPSIYLFVFITIGIAIFFIIRRINKKLAEAKIEAEESAKKALTADRAKSDFLANMSHEIRTPMNAIMGFSELMRDEVVDTKHINYLDIILSSSKTLLSLINDILDLSKIEAGKMEFQYRPTDPHALFSDIVKIFAIKLKEKGLKLITDIDETLPKAILLDEVRIRQVLFNLVGNAVKFTSEGYIELKVKGNYYADRSKIDLVFSIKDTGVGISTEDKKIIFDAFQQSSGQSIKKYGGTGLGLAITKKLVELMNGEISVDSIVGKGSTFKVTIKEVSIASIDKSIEDKKSDIENIKFSNQKILVADDIESNRLLLKELLNIYGLRIFEATNGKEAINLAAFERPDIILMDLRMPVMDGYEAIKILKSDPDLKNIPVIILTASAMKFNEEEIKKLNCEGYIRKPVNRKELITELKRFFKYTEEGGTKVKDSAKLIKDARSKDIDIKKLKKEFPEILNKLRGEVLSKLRELKKGLILNDIEDFAKEIISMGEDHELSILIREGNNMVKHATNFDLENLSKALDSFEDKLSKL